MDGYGCVLPFDNDNHDFVMGVEVGRLWEMLKTPEGIEQTVHAVNAEMILRIAEATGRTVVSEEVDDVWIIVTFSEAIET